MNEPEDSPISGQSNSEPTTGRGRDAEPATNARSWPRRILTSAAFVLWVLVLTLLTVPLLARADAKAGPGTFSFQLSPSTSGRTELLLAPLGSLSAKTHSAPVTFRIRLDEVNVVDAIGSTTHGGTKDLEGQIRDDLPGALVHVSLVIAGVTALIGAFAALAYPGGRSIRRTIAGAVIAPVGVALLAAPAALNYNPEKLFSSPEIRGPIAASENLVAKVTGLDSRFGTVQSRVEVLSSRIADLYSSAKTDEIAKSEGDVVLLHVSDLHLNGVGLALAKDLAERFKVDAVVDTGDFTSFGFAPEAGFTDQLKGFKVPYYLVPGNHDSKQVRSELKRSPYIHYVDNEAFTVGDVKILGIADPTDTALQIISKEKVKETYERQYRTTERLVERTKPDLVLVHNPVQLNPILGEVPAAAAGHLHVTKLEVIDGTVVSIVGSSGATGLGNLLVDKSQPYRFELLRFSDSKLVAIDEIELNGDGGDFTLKRRMIDPDESDTTDELPEPSQDEPSREQIEEEDPEILDAVTSTRPDPLEMRERNSDGADRSSSTTTLGPAGAGSDPPTTKGGD